MASFPTQPPQEPPLEQFGVQPVGLCPASRPAAGFWGQVADIYWEPLPPATAYLLQGEFTPQCLRFDTPAGLLEKSNRGSSFLPCLFRFAGCTQHARQFPPRRRGGAGIVHRLEKRCGFGQGVARCERLLARLIYPGNI